MKSAFKFSIALLIGLSFGFFLGGWPAQKEIQGLKESKSQLKEKLQQITEEDLKHYMKLKEQEEKFNQANEIIAKVWQIFIADLGLHVKKESMEKLQEPPAKKPEPPEEQFELAARPLPKIPTPFKPKKKPPFIQERNSAKLYDANTEEEVTQELEKLAFEDLFPKVVEAKTVSHRKLKSFNGRYDGKIKFQDPNRPTWFISMEIDSYLEGQLLKANTLIQLSDENGKVFSKASGTDDVNKDNFMEIPEVQDALVINVARGEKFIQIYKLPRLDQIMGIYYEKKTSTEYVPKGSVVLRKR